MTETIHNLVEQYGLIAVFLGCVAEGESAAILAGFFAHQGVFTLWQTFLVVFAGTFLGDMMFFLMGRRFADTAFVTRLRHRRGFSHAYRLVRDHPNIFVLTNRYIYGLRLVGGIASGMADIPPVRFVILNAIASLTWTALFWSLGYLFGLGAETLVGRALKEHSRLLLGLVIGVVVTTIVMVIAHRVMKKEPPEPDCDDNDRNVPENIR